MFCENQIKAYPANTKGVIQAILDLGRCLGAWAESIEDRLENGGGGAADLCCLFPQTPNVDYESAGIIGEDCNNENCSDSEGHPENPGFPDCGKSPDINPDIKYPNGGVECLIPDKYEWVNGGIKGAYCPSDQATPDCLIPGNDRSNFDNAGVIGCGNPNELHWVDYYWPARNEWCNAGFTGHNCDECLDPGSVPGAGISADCSVCRRGGVENLKPEFIEYNNAGSWSDDCPTAYAKPTCLIPGGDHYCCFNNGGLVGVGDPDTEEYVPHYWPGTCEYANGGLIGTGCSIGGDEWLDALDLPVEKGQCYAPYLAEYNNSGLMEGSWKCDITKKPNVGEHWFDPEWNVDFANSGAIIAIDPPEFPDPLPPENPDCCPEVGNLLPPVADDCHTHACWLPDEPEFENAGLKTSRECNVCEPCDNTPVHGQPVVVVSDTPPVEPCEGSLWFLPSRLELMVYYCDRDTCQWVPAATTLGGTGGAQAKVSDQPPVGARCGDLWHDSERQEMRVFYDDGNTRQWVPVSLAKANSPETETAMRRELDELKGEIAALKLALAGKLSD